jgi:ribosomal protein S18 acetylase RimI-like enzyme
MGITVKIPEEKDIEYIGSLFNDTVWGDTTSLIKRYFTEQLNGDRVVLMGYYEEDFAGFVTIKWLSEYPPFAEKGIPEINDLRVLPAFRRMGIASALMDKAEKRVFERSPVVGIGVGMYADYGAAQRMYILRGYVPDGLGLYYKQLPVVPGRNVRVDDELILHLIKERG